MKLIYVAGSFRATTHWGIVQNIRKAEVVALWLWAEKDGEGNQKWAVICPHLNTQNFQDALGLPEETWLRGDLEILKRCDAIFMLDNFESSEGARVELLQAERDGLEIYFQEE